MNSMENSQYYFNEDGLVVFTEAYHLQRGHCCGNGCLHCPYDYEKVSEPRRSVLINDRKQKANKSK